MDVQSHGEVSRTGLEDSRPRPSSLEDDQPIGLVLEELNHRWFNALQGLSSALHPCKSPDAGLPFIRMRLEEVDVRIRAMATLHRRLSRPDPTQPLEGYCRALCIDVLLAFGREEITPWVQMCDVVLSPARTTLIGKLVVELVTNIVKHGRETDDAGIVWITLRPMGLADLELSATDSFRPPRGPLGRPRMVEALAGALGGRLHVQSDDCYLTRIQFPAD